MAGLGRALPGAGSTTNVARSISPVGLRQKNVAHVFGVPPRQRRSGAAVSVAVQDAAPIDVFGIQANLWSCRAKPNTVSENAGVSKEGLNFGAPREDAAGDCGVGSLIPASCGGLAAEHEGLAVRVPVSQCLRKAGVLAEPLVDSRILDDNELAPDRVEGFVRWTGPLCQWR